MYIRDILSEVLMTGGTTDPNWHVQTQSKQTVLRDIYLAYI